MNLIGAMPLLAVGGAGTLALAVGWLPGRWAKRHGPTAVGLAGIAVAIVFSLILWDDRLEVLDGSLRADRFAEFFNLIFLAAALVVVILGARDPAAVDRRGEFVALLLFSVGGMMLVAGAGDLITLFVGIELLSVALYVLAALEVWRERSLESGLKYLIVGAVGSAILLYGFALLFGATGTTRLAEIAATLADGPLLREPLVIGGLALVIAGLGFKASAAPFHMWTPDVYEGAPTAVTAFMATATKAAALAAFLRIFTGAAPDLAPDWGLVIGVVAVIAIAVGNIAALVQDNLKRMLAYSSVAQAGYLLIGVATGTLQGAEATLYYLLAYLGMTLAPFAVVMIREREVEHGDRIAALAGYGRRRPAIALVMTLAMLSLAGFPPLSGFVGKFLLFGAAVEADMIWLAVAGAIGSIISLGYYLRIVAIMWLEPAVVSPRDRALALPGSTGLVTIACGASVVVLALAASPLLEACRAAAASLLAP